MAPPQLDSSGVSSSAALGCACLLALEDVNQLRLTTADNIELDRRAAPHLIRDGEVDVV